MPTVSFSRVKLWRRCHYAHHLKYHERLARKRRTVPLLRGQILGEMLDARAFPAIIKKSPEQILKKYSKQYAQLWAEEQEKYGDVPGDMAKLFDGYSRKYANEGFEYLSYEEFIAMDLVKDIRFIGYIDKRVRDTNGRMFLMDHKSHRVIPNDDQRFTDLQKVFYVWAYNETNSTKQATGFVWDYIRTKAPTVPELLKDGKRLSMAKNIDTDYWTYLGAIKRHKLDVKPYLEFLAELKKRADTRYIRVTIPNPPKAMIQSVVADLKSTAIELHTSKSKDRNMTRMCPSDCDFYNLCRAEVSGLDADYVRKNEYEVREEPNEREEAEEE
jgi:hypothetical protein